MLSASGVDFQRQKLVPYELEQLRKVQHVAGGSSAGRTSSLRECTPRETTCMPTWRGGAATDGPWTRLSKIVVNTGQKLDAKEADPAHLPNLKDVMMKWLRNGDVKRTPDDSVGSELDKFEKVMRTMMKVARAEIPRFCRRRPRSWMRRESRAPLIAGKRSTSRLLTPPEQLLATTLKDLPRGIVGTRLGHFASSTKKQQAIPDKPPIGRG
jgi:hypothetical protein